SHALNPFSGVAGGFVVAADHDYPSSGAIQLTAPDSDGLSTPTSVSIHPKPVDLTFTSNPPGLQVTVGSGSQTTPFTITAIQGATVSFSAPTPATVSGGDYGFCFWSDAGAQTHLTIAPKTATTYTATYTATQCAPQP